MNQVIVAKIIITMMISLFKLIFCVIVRMIVLLLFFDYYLNNFISNDNFVTYCCFNWKQILSVMESYGPLGSLASEFLDEWFDQFEASWLMQRSQSLSKEKVPSLSKEEVHAKRFLS